MNFQVTVLKILVSYPDGFALMADLKRDMAILATSGRDWAERTKRLAARASHLDIFSQALVERENGGWRITARGAGHPGIHGGAPCRSRSGHHAVPGRDDRCACAPLPHAPERARRRRERRERRLEARERATAKAS